MIYYTIFFSFLSSILPRSRTKIPFLSPVSPENAKKRSLRFCFPAPFFQNGKSSAFPLFENGGRHAAETLSVDCAPASLTEKVRR